MIKKAVCTAFDGKGFAVPLWCKSRRLFKKAFGDILHLFAFRPLKCGTNNLSSHNNPLCLASEPVVEFALGFSASYIQFLTSYCSIIAQRLTFKRKWATILKNMEEKL